MVAYPGKEGAGRIISMKKDREKQDSQSRPLTQKQEKFVQLLISGKSQREAYKEAYGCEGWKPENIDSQASRTLKKPKVAARYEEARSKIVSNDEMSAEGMRKFIVSRLRDIASGKVCDETTVYDGEGNVTKVQRTVRQADIQNAMDKLASWYGIQPEINTSAEVTVQLRGDADGYGD
jgi:phage terminase small subunit